MSNFASMLSESTQVKVYEAAVSCLMTQKGYSSKDTKEAIKNGESVAFIEEINFDDTNFFFTSFQSAVTKAGVHHTLGDLFDMDGNAVGGEYVQAEVNANKVKDILLAKDTGLLNTGVMFTDIEVIKVEDGLPFIGGGRHRRQAILDALLSLGFSLEQAFAQEIRCQELTFGTLDHAMRYVLTSNGSRTMTPAEKQGYLLTASTGCHHKDTDSLLDKMSEEGDSSLFSYVISNMIADDFPIELKNNTSMVWAKSMLRQIMSVTDNYVRDDGSVVITQSKRPKTYKRFGLLLANDPRSFCELAYDSLCSAVLSLKNTGKLPTNLARDYSHIIEFAVMDMVNVELDDEFIPPVVPRKVPVAKTGAKPGR